MASWGKCNFEELKKLQERMNNFEKKERQKFFEAAAKELAARLLAKVIRRTPVGQYPHRVGGTLRRGWTGGKRKSAKGFVDSLKVMKNGDTYSIEITNNVEYAPYVEYGHRTKDHKGWVPGRFMLTISEKELQQQMPVTIEKKIQKFFGDVFK